MALCGSDAAGTGACPVTPVVDPRTNTPTPAVHRSIESVVVPFTVASATGPGRSSSGCCFQVTSGFNSVAEVRTRVSRPTDGPSRACCSITSADRSAPVVPRHRRRDRTLIGRRPTGVGCVSRRASFVHVRRTGARIGGFEQPAAVSSGEHVVTLTGAGVSTGSGTPEFEGYLGAVRPRGVSLRPPPTTHSLSPIRGRRPFQTRPTATCGGVRAVRS